MAEELAVFLDGERAGTLSRGRDGRVGFDYSSGYLQRRRVTPLSVSLPTTRRSHDADVVEPWIDNLLPDNDDVRQRWAAAFGERRPTAFNLLRHMGADCAGAVQLLPPGEPPDDAGTKTRVSDAEIADHLRTLRSDESAWSFAESGGRWSLGGQQGKFALSRDRGGWYVPGGREPSTHIFKIGIAGLSDSDVAEYVTMRAARSLGLTVAPIEIVRFGDEVAVVVTRFDRLGADAGIRRIHQEDMCQALGLWRASKYQSDGGPSVADIAGLLSNVTDRRDLDSSRRLFARANIFNWLVAGTDAHAKNYALLHVGPRTAMAPLYDLMSSALVLPEREVHHQGKLAMKLGGEYRLRAIERRHLVRAAADIGVEADWLQQTAATYAEHLPDAIAAAVDDADDLIDAPLRAQFVDAIARRVDQISSTTLGTTSRNGGSDSDEGDEGELRGADVDEGSVWVSPHTRNGRVVDGHHRARPGRAGH